MDSSNPKLTAYVIVQIVAFFATIIAVVTAGFWLAARFQTDEDGMLALVGGAALTLATMFKPDVFWYHAKALFLRALIGDRATTVVYLILAIGLMLFGVLRLQYWERYVAECRQMYAAAATSQERMAVLQRPAGPPAKSVFGTYRPSPCYEYRERRPF